MLCPYVTPVRTSPAARTREALRFASIARSPTGSGVCAVVQAGGIVPKIATTSCRRGSHFVTALLDWIPNPASDPGEAFPTNVGDNEVPAIDSLSKVNEPPELSFIPWFVVFWAAYDRERRLTNFRISLPSNAGRSNDFRDILDRSLASRVTTGDQGARTHWSPIFQAIPC